MVYPLWVYRQWIYAEWSVLRGEPVGVGELTVARQGIMLVLMRRRSLLRPVALLALAQLGAVTTGLPSHSHDGSETVGIESPDHHGHGVQLVDQGPRVAGGVVAFIVPPAAAVHFGAPPTNAAAPVTEAPRPRDRGPPASIPRAPPILL